MSSNFPLEYNKPENPWVNAETVEATDVNRWEDGIDAVTVGANELFNEIGALTTALNNKVDLNCENANVASKTQKGVTQFCGTAPTTVSSASESRPAVVIKNYKNGTTWYRKWSDGFIEQGGFASYSTKTFTFPVPFSNTNITLSGVSYYTGGTSSAGDVISGLSTTAVTFWMNGYSAGGVYVEARGY